VNRRYRRLDLDPDRSQDVEQPAGAFLMLRRDALERVGLLDEEFYPLWFEDVDLCLRLARAGYTLRYAPAAVAEHQGGHSLRTVPAEARCFAWYGNLLRFGNKHLSRVAGACLRPLLLMGVFVRWLACLVTNGRAAERRAYLSTMRFLLGGRPVDGAEMELRTTSTVGS
jgi:GT2 family glycosyltransferase